MARAVRELDDTYFAERRIRVDYVSIFPNCAMAEVLVARLLCHRLSLPFCGDATYPQWKVTSW